MVFVHARNETVRTANVLCEFAKNQGDISVFLPDENIHYNDIQKAVSTLLYVCCIFYITYSYGYIRFSEI